MRPRAATRIRVPLPAALSDHDDRGAAHDRDLAAEGCGLASPSVELTAALGAFEESGVSGLATSLQRSFDTYHVLIVYTVSGRSEKLRSGIKHLTMIDLQLISAGNGEQEGVRMGLGVACAGRRAATGPHRLLG